MGGCLSCLKEPAETALNETTSANIKQEMPENHVITAPTSSSTETVPVLSVRSVPSSIQVETNILSNGNHILTYPEQAVTAPISRFYSYQWRLQNKGSVGQMGSVDSKNCSESKLNVLFDGYKDAKEDAILEEGIVQFCSDLQVSPEEFQVLVLAWKLQAKQMCKFTRMEFVNGMKSMRVDSIKALQCRLPELVQEVSKSPELFKDLYRFAFRFGLDSNSGQRILPSDLAILLWKLVFTVHEPPILQRWLAFLEKHQQYVRGITKDTWNMFLNFAESVADDLSSYDDNEAWPTLFDDFVEHENDRTNQNVKKDVERDEYDRHVRIRRDWEGQRPLFDRNDIIVNQEEHLEERIVVSDRKSKSPSPPSGRREKSRSFSSDKERLGSCSRSKENEDKNSRRSRHRDDEKEKRSRYGRRYSRSASRNRSTSLERDRNSHKKRLGSKSPQRGDDIYRPGSSRSTFDKRDRRLRRSSRSPRHRSSRDRDEKRKSKSRSPYRTDTRHYDYKRNTNRSYDRNDRRSRSPKRRDHGKRRSPNRKEDRYEENPEAAAAAGYGFYGPEFWMPGNVVPPRGYLPMGPRGPIPFMYRPPFLPMHPYPPRYYRPPRPRLSITPTVADNNNTSAASGTNSTTATVSEPPAAAVAEKSDDIPTTSGS